MNVAQMFSKIMRENAAAARADDDVAEDPKDCHFCGGAVDDDGYMADDSTAGCHYCVPK